MGLILNNNVEETKIYSAYGLTVYGKVNRYVWTVTKEAEENALITMRIADAEGNNIFSMQMGNNVILQCRIDDTMDNFLYWMATEKPDAYTIEKQIYKSLCQSDSLFNHHMMNRKIKDKRKAEEEKRLAERQEMEKKHLAEVETYCKEKGYFFYNYYGEITILKATTNDSRKMLADAQSMERMQTIIDYVRKYPDNNEIKVIKEDSLENIVDWIK